MIDLSKMRHIHFVGIGGIMMSGIAEILHNKSFIITGSDRQASDMTDHLNQTGINVTIGHFEDNVVGADLVVYSSAIPESNVELIQAKSLEIPTLSRSEMIGEMMVDYNMSIAVAGAHGKTTTTSMIANILNHSESKPTILVGGIAADMGSNVQLGDDSVMLLEACEYKENFLDFNQNIGVILNIDEDHLDYYDDLEHIIQAFVKFAKKIPENGVLIVNNDDYNARKVVSHVSCEVLTFGINTDSIFQAKNITFNDLGHSKFDVYHNEELFGTFSLKFPGQHNIYNALASIVSAYAVEMSKETIIESIKAYRGARRRFEILGEYNGATIIDDYAHHPNEIKPTLAAAKKIPHNKVTAIFQPHTYTRTNHLMLQFATAFNDADDVIITDIYAAREKDDQRVHSRDLVKEIAHENESVKYIEDFEGIIDYIKATAQPNDLILVLGAGNIREVGEQLVK